MRGSQRANWWGPGEPHERGAEREITLARHAIRDRLTASFLLTCIVRSLSAKGCGGLERDGGGRGGGCCGRGSGATAADADGGVRVHAAAAVGGGGRSGAEGIG